MKLHGVLRGLRPVKEDPMNEWEWQLLEEKTSIDHLEIWGIEVRTGSRVRLRPREGGDVMDIALAGQIATIECIEQDYEGKCHVCVVLEKTRDVTWACCASPAIAFFLMPKKSSRLSEEEAREYQPVQKPSILVAGIGNIFLGDDAFGVEVVRRMAGLKLPENVRVSDFGIRGFDLAYALQDGYETTILVDACPHGQPPGTIYVIEPDLKALDDPGAPQAAVEAHSMSPKNVLRMARAMNIELKNILLVGCEPETLGGEEGQMGLSAPVETAVDDAVKLVESLVKRILYGDGPGSKLQFDAVRHPKTMRRRAMENGNGNFNDKDTLFMLGGVALIVFGAGLILSNPIARRYMGQLGVGDLASLALPDLDRYLKLRAM